MQHWVLLEPSLWVLHCAIDVTSKNGDASMLWYCAFTWYPQITREQVAQRVVQQHDAGTNRPERIRGWYNLAGGGSGFLLLETDSPQEVTAFAQPYMDLMSWDVRAVYELNYDQMLQELRQVSQAQPSGPPGTRPTGGQAAP
jgi:(2Fe-2S) ferredoxin